jgi:trans-2,3-dihydro-3-hydroxyanthranilate isomerase
MGRLSFAIVDVFTTVPLTGNALAVVPDAEQLDLATMRGIAREFNQAETTFLLPATKPEASWRLRSFLPTGVEVYGAGHNALGAWWWLAAAGRLALDQPRTSWWQEIGDRVLPLEVIAEQGQPSEVVMSQAAPSFGQEFGGGAALASALELASTDLDFERLPAQVVGTGAAHLMVPAHSREVVDRARWDAGRLGPLLSSVGAEGCYLFSLDPEDAAATAHARFFSPLAGAEDPATGSAAGPLACYLIARGVVDDGTGVVVAQGVAMGRPCRIEVRVRGKHVEIAGRAVVTVEGILVLP